MPYQRADTVFDGAPAVGVHPTTAEQETLNWRHQKSESVYSLLIHTSLPSPASLSLSWSWNETILLDITLK